MCFRPSALINNGVTVKSSNACPTCGMPTSPESNECAYCHEPIPSNSNKDAGSGLEASGNPRII